MANYNNLKNAIKSVIKANGNQEITGDILQNALLSIINSLGAGYQFVGIATPETNPGILDQKVFYIANGKGTYTNFGGLIVDEDEVIILYYDTDWHKLLTGIASDEKLSELGQYVENQEWVRVVTDSDGKILYGVKTDGKFYFGDGCPPQVQEYVQNIIDGLSLDEYEDIVAFLADLEKGDETLQDLLDKKVDGEYVENLEYIEVKTDAEDKILEATEKDGTKVFGGDVKILGNMEVSGVSYKVIENPEYLAAWVDAENKIIFGFKTDGKTYIGDADFLNAIEDIKTFIQNITDKNIDWDALSSITTVENPEYIEAKTDSEGKLLAGRTSDGAAFEKVGFSTPKISIDGHTTETIEDQERRSEITIDSKGKVISYRDANGMKHEEVGIKANNANINHLNLTSEGMSDFQQALKNSGFNPGGAGDWSDKDSMYIPEPRLAHLNIITDFNLKNLTKTSDVKCAVEFWDGTGNYFKKYVILNGQGRSSMRFVKKGLGIDFFNENPNSQDFDKDNIFSIKIGDWVYQDSFHIKSFYTDWPRCTCPVMYKLADEIMRTHGVMADRPYKKYYVGKFTAGQVNMSNIDQNAETGAKCLPAGFPVIVYQNGEFWGVNSWQLKKHRDNYQLSKKKATNIHLDGLFRRYTSEGVSKIFWLYNGVIDWAHYCSGADGIETRNPKDLYCVDGKKYNADTHDAEIITTAIAEEWIAAGQIIPTGKVIDDTLAGQLRTTGKVRANIEALTTYVPTIQQMAIISTSNGDISISGYGGVYDSKKNFSKGIYVLSEGRYYMSIHTTNTGNPVSDENNWIDITSNVSSIKAAIEDRFDVSTFIDYIVLGETVGNVDAYDNNGQIITWGAIGDSNNLNWSVNFYDWDIVIGTNFLGNAAYAPDHSKLSLNRVEFPLYALFWDFYLDDMKARYAELRDKGILDADHITQMFRDWMDRVGHDNYVKEYNKWPDSPCFRPSGEYPDDPYTGGWYGSIYRIYLWLKQRIEYVDAQDFFDYNN